MLIIYLREEVRAERAGSSSETRRSIYFQLIDSLSLLNGWSK